MEVVDQIGAAWLDVVDNYENSLISSEATLQSFLFCSLKHQFPRLEIHCEVGCLTGAQLSCFPDILVVKGSAVLAVVEIKFSPEAMPPADLIEGDLDKLAAYAAASAPFKVRMNPRSGKYDGEAVSFTRDTVFAFAIIAPERARSRCADAVASRANPTPLLLFSPSTK